MARVEAIVARAEAAVAQHTGNESWRAVPGGDGVLSRGMAYLSCRYITVVISAMAIAYSKLTAQGQISVPTEVRRRLGIGPGSVLEWDEEGERIVVRRAGRYTSEDVHRALFNEAPEPRSLDQLKEGVRQYVKSRHARR